MTDHLYRLDVTYPPDADRINDRWPRVRPYLSRLAAERRADELREMGATVIVVESNPITWPDDRDLAPRPRPRAANGRFR